MICLMEDEFILEWIADNGMARFHKLKKMDVYEDVVRYMLCNNVKLEQEIVGLTLMKNK